MSAPRRCARCAAPLPATLPPGVGGPTGNAIATNPTTGAVELVCYDCAATAERAAMIRTGRAMLYEQEGSTGRHITGVANWPGKMSFPVRHVTHGRHNLAGTRVDVWFIGPEGQTWHGWRAGDNGTYLRCRRSGPIPYAFLAAHPEYLACDHCPACDQPDPLAGAPHHCLEEARAHAA